MTDEKLDTWVGLFLLPVLAAGVATVLLIGNQPLRPTMFIYVEMDRVGLLKEGAPVRIGRQDIGKVESIRFHFREENGKKIRKVRIRVWLYRKFRKQVFTNSNAYVASIALIGLRHLEIAPPKHVPGRFIREGDVIKGESPAHLDRLLAMTYQSITVADSTFTALKPHVILLAKRVTSIMKEVDQLRGIDTRLSKTMDRALTGFNEAQAIWRRIQGIFKRVEQLQLYPRNRRIFKRLQAGVRPLLRDVERMLALAEAFLKTIRNQAAPTIKRIQAQIEATLKRVAVITKAAEYIAKHIAKGEGTVGAFMKDRELWDDFKVSGKIIRQRSIRVIVRPKLQGVDPKQGHPALP